MKYHFNTITPDMTNYHTFNEINVETTAAIIETGFLNLDRAILTEQPDLVAKGVTAGILCFVRNEPVNPQEPLKRMNEDGTNRQLLSRTSTESSPKSNKEQIRHWASTSVRSKS
jgi:hypothetical protein